MKTPPPLKSRSVEVDLTKSAEISAIALWHFHRERRVYFNVIVQISDDASFKKDVTTVYNNDAEGELGLGKGKDYCYYESNEGRVIAVHQPHRFTRLSHHFDEFCACFNDADVVGISEVFGAGEDPIPGASHADLVAGLIRHGHRHARVVDSEDDLERLVREQAKPGDMVVCLGAGTISTWANRLPDRLKA